MNASACEVNPPLKPPFAACFGQQWNATAARLNRHMLELQVAQVAGVIEATRMEESDDFEAVFGHIHNLIADARRHLSELGHVLDQLRVVATGTPAKAQEITALTEAMKSQAQTLVLA